MQKQNSWLENLLEEEADVMLGGCSLTKARDIADLICSRFTEADIPNLSAFKITTGKFEKKD